MTGRRVVIVGRPDGRAGSQAAAAAAFGADVTLLGVPGTGSEAGSEVGPADRQDAAAALGAAGAVLVSLEVPVRTALRLVAGVAAPLVVHAAPPVRLPRAVPARASVLAVSVRGLATVTGAAVSPPTPAAGIALARSLGCDVVVMLGSAGALAVPAAGPAAHIPVPPVRVRDEAGAGDCFCGALVTLVAEGAALAEAACMAVAAASLSVTEAGARGLLPWRAAAGQVAAGLEIRPAE
jgi:ribokinase